MKIKKTKTYKETVFVNHADAITICNAQGHSGIMDENTAISVTARFPDGNQMDIKCHGRKKNIAQVEATLFAEDDSQLCGPHVGFLFFTTWLLEYEGVTYIAEVKMAQFAPKEKTPDTLYQYICKNFTLDGPTRRLINNAIHAISKKIPAESQIGAIEDVLSPIGITYEEIERCYEPVPIDDTDCFIKQTRAVKLLSNLIYNYAKETAKTAVPVIRWCLDAGFEPEELTHVFRFQENEVAQVMAEIEKEE